ncbi:uncharacterized mitochondrial protein AtMg00810-like [Capsicum annuum]|uniref:uncharacterized mitochondrial protein AtMg00810-like n=1 Tax=Capsicum annuum TaxID=4072 RepID=UPI001FB05061|nr:uncharacterized mitochondrial protein AtMg00810-like [Capsicum annuum]
MACHLHGHETAFYVGKFGVFYLSAWLLSPIVFRTPLPHRLVGIPASTPIEFNHKLAFLEFYKHLNHNSELDKELSDSTKYQRLVGRLLYLTMTRPDIVFVVQVLSQFMHSPNQSPMEAALRVARYIKGTAGLRLFMPSSRCSNLVAFCDSDWGSYVETRKSVTGYIVKFGDAVIS